MLVRGGLEFRQFPIATAVAACPVRPSNKLGLALARSCARAHRRAAATNDFMEN